MAIYRHPDGTYHRFPYREQPAKAMQPIACRPNWWRDAEGVEHYVEPLKPTGGTAS